MKYFLVLLGTLYKFHFALVFFVTLTIIYPFFKFLLRRGNQYDKVFGLFKKVCVLFGKYITWGFEGHYSCSNNNNRP
ncbi:MAG: hypothetical protein DRI54_09130 [Bacteroidetes bacterium]|nr:MAG: hypothetical protein DRI54_09130 [Bacteroidota bacterium]